MNILITDTVDPLLLKLLDNNNVSYEYNIKDSENILLKSISQFQGLIVRNRLKIDKSFLKKSKNLKFIARYGSGMESIDTETATKFNIKC